MTKEIRIVCSSCGQSVLDPVENPSGINEDLESLLSKLRDDYSPPPSEANDIRNTLGDDLDALAELDKEYSHLRRALALMRKRREVLSTSAQRKSSLLAPIRCLPKELLSHIMTLACETDFFAPPDQYQVELLTLWMSQVSRFWRQLSTSIPSLWSKYQVLVGNPPRHAFYDNGSGGFLYRDYDRDISPVLQIYLERSKGHSLDVEIMSGENHLWTMASIRESDLCVVRSLLDQVSRWERLVLDTNSIDALAREQSDLSRLRSLEIWNGGHDEDNLGNLRPYWFSNASNIEILTINLSPIPFDYFSLNWGRIRHLNLTLNLQPFHSLPQALQNVSTLCTVLTELHLQISGDPIYFEEAYLFPCLEILDVDSGNALSLIVAPHLKHLDISLLGPKGDNLSLLLSNFLRGSNAALVSLTAHSDLFTCDDYADCLVPHLEDLQGLTCVDTEKAVFTSIVKTLSLDSAGRGPLPRLRRITFQCRPNDPVNPAWYGDVVHLDDDLLSMLEDRRYCHKPQLETLEIAYPAESGGQRRSAPFKCSPEIRERLNSLSDNGLLLCFNQDWSPIPGL